MLGEFRELNGVGKLCRVSGLGGLGGIGGDDLDVLSTVASLLDVAPSGDLVDIGLLADIRQALRTLGWHREVRSLRPASA
jgi:hypothetical protein